MTPGDPRPAQLGSDPRRGEGDHLTERRVPGERQQFRAMPTSLADKEPLIAVIGGGDDVSVSASESARCLNNHEGSVSPGRRRDN